MSEGELLGGRYRLIRALGTGGAGHTWLAQDTTTGGRVTVKELHHPIQGAGESLVEREARLLGQLDHPQVPRFVDAFVEEVRLLRRLHLVLEFVEGEPLDRELQRRRFTQAEAVALIDDILGVVAWLHALAPPVIHRDLKPSNVILRPDGRVAIIDFGLATDAVDRTFQHTMAAGTLGYQAPEQIAGDPRPASDVYSIGVLALALLTRIEAHTLLEWQTLRWRGAASQLDPSLRDWLERALDPDPDLRFGDAGEALAALRAQGPADAPTTPAERRAPAPSSPRRGWRGSTPLVAGLILGGVVVGAAVVWLSAPPSLAPASPSPAPTPSVPRPAALETPADPASSSAPACRAGSGQDCLEAARDLLAAPAGEAPRDADTHLAMDLLAIGCMGGHLGCCAELAERTEAQAGPEAAARWWSSACQLGDPAACDRASPGDAIAPE